MAPVEEPKLTEVALSIYDLRGTWALNHATRLFGVGGAFHVGVEVYRMEWSYGWTSRGTGVYVGQVGQSWQGPLRERVPLGHTSFTADEVMRILRELREKWIGPGYHPLRKNCGHFSVELAKRLQVKEAPPWVNTLAGLGDSILQSFGVFVRPLTLASHPSLAGCSTLELSSELLDIKREDLSSDKRQDDPRVERQWQWAIEKMRVYALEAS